MCSWNSRVGGVAGAQRVQWAGQPEPRHRLRHAHWQTAPIVCGRIWSVPQPDSGASLDRRCPSGDTARVTAASSLMSSYLTLFPSVGTPGPGYASTYGTFAPSVPLVESLQLRKLIRLPCLHYSVYLLTALQNDSGRVRARPPAPLPCCFPMPVSCV